MHNGEQMNPNGLSSVFEGFFLQMVIPGLEHRAKKVVSQALGSDWNVKPIGDNHTEFEVTKKNNGLSVKQAWDKTYYLRSRPGVVDAEPLFAVPLPSNPDLNQEQKMGIPAGKEPQDGTTEVEWHLKQMRVLDVWSRFFPDPKQPPGHGILIGLPDTGYSEHPEIIPNLLLDKSYDFFRNDKNAIDDLDVLTESLIPNAGHGTSTASVMISPRNPQAKYPNGKWVTGVAPGAKVVPLRVSNSVVLLSVRNLAESIEYAANTGIHVLSISLGSGFFNKRLLSAITYAQKRGVILIAAAGTYIQFVVWPAAYDEVIAVASSDIKREIWWGSSRGSKVDVCAPGAGIWYAKVTKNDGVKTYDIRQGSGTSFSAPIVAGIAALWLSYHGREKLIERYGAEKIPFIFNQILRDSCEKFPTWKPGLFGEGIVNAEKVLTAPLPNDVNSTVIAPAFALQGHPPVDSGRLDTFAHLFEQQLAENQSNANFMGAVRDNSKLRAALSQVLQTTEAELPKRLKEVGQELAFYFATNPELYKQFAEALSSAKPQTTQFKAESLTPLTTSNNLESVRQKLLSQGVSEVLKTKIRS